MSCRNHAFWSWLSGPPHSLVLSDLSPTTPPNHPASPLDTSGSRPKYVLDSLKMTNFLPGCFPQIITAKTKRKTRIRHMNSQRRMGFTELPVFASLRVRSFRSSNVSPYLCAFCEQIDSRSSRCKTQVIFALENQIRMFQIMNNVAGQDAHVHLFCICVH